MHFMHRLAEMWCSSCECFGSGILKTIKFVRYLFAIFTLCAHALTYSQVRTPILNGFAAIWKCKLYPCFLPYMRSNKQLVWNKHVMGLLYTYLQNVDLYQISAHLKAVCLLSHHLFVSYPFVGFLSSLIWWSSIYIWSKFETEQWAYMQDRKTSIFETVAFRNRLHLIYG